MAGVAAFGGIVMLIVLVVSIPAGLVAGMVNAALATVRAGSGWWAVLAVSTVGAVFAGGVLPVMLTAQPPVTWTRIVASPAASSRTTVIVSRNQK